MTAIPVADLLHGRTIAEHRGGLHRDLAGEHPGAAHRISVRASTVPALPIAKQLRSGGRVRRELRVAPQSDGETRMLKTLGRQG